MGQNRHHQPSLLHRVPRGLRVTLAVLLVAAIVFATYHFLVVPPEPSVPFQDHFEIWPREDHNVHAIEAYGTLAVAVISVLIAYLIWRSVEATLEEVESHKHLVHSTNDLVAQYTKAIQTSALQNVAVEILKLGRWMADNPDFAKEMALPANQETAVGEAVATVHADFMDAVFSQEDLYRPEDVDLWITWFQNRMEMWPQLDKFMRTHLHWYPPYMSRVFQHAEAPEGNASAEARE